jgi:hypothetical protein
MKPRLALLALPLASGALLALEGSASAADEKRRADILDPDSSLMIEARFGPYRPDVDGEPSLGGKTPYADTFGDSTRFMLGLEVDWEAVHLAHVGSLSVGGWFGWTRSTGNARVTKTGAPSDEETTLWLLPIGALVVARVDVLARETPIPLVPYAKFGIGTALWEATNGRGTSHADGDGVEGRGHTNGLIYAIGASFLLDSLQPQTAKTFRVEQGVNHTYLFLEWTVTAFNGLGQTGALRTGDSTWNLGFSFEM